MWHGAKSRDDEPISAERFLHVVLRNDSRSGIQKYCKAALMGQWITRDVVGMSGDDNPPNAPRSKEGLTALQNLQFSALTVAMQYVEVSYAAGLHEE